MNKNTWIVILVIIIIVLCGLWLSSFSRTKENSVVYPEGSMNAVRAVQVELSQDIGRTKNEVKVVSVEEEEWSDSCLGLGTAAEICAAVITPGFKIVYSYDDEVYVFRTNTSGTVVRREN